MTIDIDPDRFAVPADLAAGIAGKNVLITGAGKHHGLGQAFAFACGLNGAASVAVHFHRSYGEGLETVERLRALRGNAFPVQADITNPGDVWAMRSHVMRKLGGKPPDIVICNSGLAEAGYVLGRAPKSVEGETIALRRARARQAFVTNLEDSRAVVETKVLGFLGMTHLWGGEAVFANRPVTLVYISSRQALDPGAGVPGYVLANWSVLALPKILGVNLGKSAPLASAFSVALPFVRTGMTEAYADNPRVFGRWQPRMLEAHEAARALLALLRRPARDLDGGIYQLDAAEAKEEPPGLRLSWSQVKLAIETSRPAWGGEAG